MTHTAWLVDDSSQRVYREICHERLQRPFWRGWRRAVAEVTETAQCRAESRCLTEIDS